MSNNEECQICPLSSLGISEPSIKKNYLLSKRALPLRKKQGQL